MDGESNSQAIMKQIIKVELYRTFFKDNTLNKLLKEHGYEIEQYSFFGEEKKYFLTKIEYILREFLCFLKLLFKIKAFRNQKILCLGGYYSTLMICRVFPLLLGKDFRLFIYNFYLHEAGERRIVKRILRFLLNNRKLVLIVQSPQEIDYYKSLANIPIHFVPYCSNMNLQSNNADRSVPFNNYIFTGGYTNRDYSLILECAKKLPRYIFVLAMSALNEEVKTESLPVNIHLYKDISKQEFETLVSQATVVIVPLKKDVGSSGQMLCLSAMQNKKPIIYCNVSAINYYFTEETGIPYEINNSHSAINNIEMLMSDKEKRERIGNKAFSYYKTHYTIDNRNQLLFNIIESYE